MPRAKKKVGLTRKDRTYIQKGTRAKSLTIRTSHTINNPLQWIDEKGVPRSLRYATNQSSIFMDEQDGDVILGRIVMIDGVLKVPSTNMVLQEFLDKHPHNGVLFEEFDPEAKAEKEFSQEELNYKAMKCIFDANVTTLNSLGLALFGGKSKKLTTSELKRDLIIEAKKDPKTVIDLANDSDLSLLALASDALDAGLLTKKNDKIYAGEDLVLEIPYNADVEETIKQYMKTKDGAKLKKYIETKLK